MSFWKNKYIFASLIAGISTLLFILFAYFHFFELWQLKLSDYLYGNHAPSEDIVMVLIDDPTLARENGLSHIDTWERSIYAKVLNNIGKYEPKAVVFDIFFEKEKDEPGDNYLAKSILESSFPIILGYPTYYEDSESTFKYILPLPLLIKDNTWLGIANTYPDMDDVVRKYSYGDFNKTSVDTHPSLALSTIEAISGLDIPGLEESFINNYADNSSGQKYSFISFYRVFKDEYDGSTFNPSDFKDKIVIIGVYTDLLGDSYQTPVGQLYGMEIHANAMQTILEQRFLRNVSLAEQAALIFVLCFLGAFIFMLSKIRWSLVVLVVVPVFYTLLAPVAFANGIILDMVHPYLALPTVFVASYMYRYI